MIASSSISSIIIIIIIIIRIIIINIALMAMMLSVETPLHSNTTTLLHQTKHTTNTLILRGIIRVFFEVERVLLDRKIEKEIPAGSCCTALSRILPECCIM